MIRVMRIVNGVALALALLIGVVTAVMNGMQEGVPRALGAVVGALILASPFYLAMRGLRAQSVIADVDRAAVANFVVLILMAVFGIVFARRLAETHLIVVFAWCAPIALTLIALSQRKRHIVERTFDERMEPVGIVEEPLPEPVPPAPVSTPVVRGPEPRRANYFLRHWRGELSLPVSYWINGTLLASVGLTLLLTGLQKLMVDQSLRQAAWMSMAVLALAILSWVWSVVGIWRSANRRRASGGGWGWATTAQIMMVVSVVVVGNRVVTSFLPQFKEYFQIATGHDPMGKVEVVSIPEHHTVLVKGVLGEGAADAVKAALDAMPSATTLILDSNGGRLLEARHLAAIVRQRRLSTYTEGMCASACTYVFLAGKDRVASENAAIGFHQPDFVGLTPADKQSMIRDMAAVYRNAGLPEDFISHIVTTPPDDLWFPTMQELIDAHVITDITPENYD